ncbi:MAG: hypothetical protein JWP97_3215 [Labilithrix sp.]|nr:hypothetical protein [Labilithrix sp.]
MISRRQALLTSLFGAGSVGLRALATGLPAALLVNPRRALADGNVPSCGVGAPQFVILSTSSHGDPLNCNAPGMYEDARILHPQDAAMAPRSLTLGGVRHTAAAPWATLPQSVLDRTSFWHVMTDTPVHGNEQAVLRLNGLVQSSEMLPSFLAQKLAPCLGTVQAKAVSVASSPAESLTSGGKQLPLIPPRSLQATLTNPGGPLKDLQPLRDRSLNELYGIYKTSATPAQKAFIDSLVTSQQQVRNLSQDLLSLLAGIKDDSTNAQIIAAVTLIKMKVAPLVSLNIPFGADNHSDPGLALETSQTISGVASIAFLMQQLTSAGLQDQVTFMSLNVFGRTLGAGNDNGRQHNANHQVSMIIGKPFRGGVVGGVGPVDGDFGAVAIESQTGKGTPGGDIKPLEALPSLAKTLLSGVGVDPGGVAAGKVVQAALA